MPFLPFVTKGSIDEYSSAIRRPADLSGESSGIPIKQPAGETLVTASGTMAGAALLTQEQKQAREDRVNVVVQTAESKLLNVLGIAGRVLNKAVPAAIASCASLQYTGGIGSFENFLSPLYLRMKFFQVDGDRAAFVGRPCCKTVSLSTLTGFALCENVKLDLPGTSTEPPATLEEQQIVVRYLEAGVYIE